MNVPKSSCVVLFLAAFAMFGIASVSAQTMQRPRVVSTVSSIPTTQVTSVNSTSRPTSGVRPPLLPNITVVGANNNPQPLVKKTASSAPINASTKFAALSPALAAFNQRLSQAMDSRLGIRYRYGATGTNAIDCSGLVWQVFQEAGIRFERSSAANYWRNFEPVSGDERYKFGTLVFFNDLGHVGIVVNDKGFYHASSSKGVTYSSFAGYWEKRIIGFRRIPLGIL